MVILTLALVTGKVHGGDVVLIGGIAGYGFYGRGDLFR
jgi:hypothetical protein